jgi:hypothetical protein
MKHFTGEDINSVEVLRRKDGKPEKVRITFDDGSIYVFQVDLTDDAGLLGAGECVHAVTNPIFDEAGEPTHSYRCVACGKVLSQNEGTI